MPGAKVDSFGVTDVGLEREENQDCIYTDQERGFYLVLDGMGGHQGGRTASHTGCEIVAERLEMGLDAGLDPGTLLVDSVKAAGSQIHLDANRNTELHGMGTTFVGIVLVNPQLALIAHVGDSRAYLMRDHRLLRLTEDHTVVAELVALGKLTPAEAHNHPHSSVLSRNLGGLHATNVDLTEVELLSGDRLLLCSDGLNGYASQGDIETITDGALLPESAAADLVDLALRGGGGDNVSVVIIDIDRNSDENANANNLPNTLSNVDRDGAQAWWKRRSLFLDVCEEMGLADSKIASGLDKEEAQALLANSYCEAVYHDLHKGSGVHVWTFADSLVSAWFSKSSSYEALRELFDTLRAASLAVAQDLGEHDPDFGVCLEIALLRSLVVAEMVIGGKIGARIQMLSDEIAQTAPSTELPEGTFSGDATVPFGDINSSAAQSDEVASSLRQSLEAAKVTVSSDRNPYANTILQATNISAQDYAGKREMHSTAQELYGSHLLGESELNTIIAAMDRCRSIQLLEIRRGLVSDPAAKSTAYYILSSAHQLLFHALALVVIEAGKPTSDRLHEHKEQTVELRLRVSRNQSLVANAVDIETGEEQTV